VETRKRLLRLAWPIMLSNVTVPLVGAVDVFVIGHQPDAALLAGLGLGASVFSLAFFAFNFLRMGTTGPTAQAAGAGDMDEARAILFRALALAVAIGLLLVIARPLISYAAFSLTPAEPAVEAAADAYLQIRLLAAPAALAEIVLVGWLWGLQHIRAAFILQVITNLINIVLDLWFVLELGWGVEGAAAASAIAHGAGAVLGLLIVRRKLGGFGGLVRKDILNWSRIRRMLAVNRDIFIRTICVVGGFLLFRAEANRFGAVEAAAIETLYQFVIISAYALDGFSHAVEPMVGEAIGRRDPKSLRAAAIAAFQAGGIVAVVMSGFLLLFGPDIIRILTNIPTVIEAADARYMFAALLPAVSVWCYLLDGMFLGAALNTIVRNAMLQTMAIYLLALYTLPDAFGLDGLWYAIIVFNLVRAATLALAWKRLLGSARSPI
jgi:MATE family multidrug resistance protein